MKVKVVHVTKPTYLQDLHYGDLFTLPGCNDLYMRVRKYHDNTLLYADVREGYIHIGDSHTEIIPVKTLSVEL